MNASHDGESIRAAFEWWASDEGESPASVERAGNGYKLAKTQAYWMAWNAALASVPVAGKQPYPAMPEPDVIAYGEAEDSYSRSAVEMAMRSAHDRGYSVGWDYGKEHASAPVADRQRLRDLVDVVWNEATNSTAVPSTPWADRMIDKVFPSLPDSALVAGEAQPVYYVQTVPDHCDRIVWKGRYFSLPLDAAPQASPAADEWDDFEAWLYLGQTEFEPSDLSKEAVAIARFAYSVGRAARAKVAAADGQDAAFEAVRKRLCKLPRSSFLIGPRPFGGVQRVDDSSGRWVEFDAVHQLFDPVQVDAAITAQHKGE